MNSKTARGNYVAHTIDGRFCPICGVYVEGVRRKRMHHECFMRSDVIFIRQRDGFYSEYAHKSIPECTFILADMEIMSE